MREADRWGAVLDRYLRTGQSEINVLLLPTHPDPEKQHVIVTDEMVSQALMHHADHQDRFGNFTDAEAAIRDAFDGFLGGLDRFETFIVARLVEIEDVAPYLDYWLEHLSIKDASDDEQRLVALNNYIEVYGFDGVTNLIARYKEYKTPNTGCSRRRPFHSTRRG